MPLVVFSPIGFLDGSLLPQALTPSHCLPEAMRGTLSQMMDFSLLKDPVFVLIGIANVFGMLGFYTPYVYLPGAAEEKGIDGTRATFLISIIGITNTVGRVLSGLLADMDRVNALYVNNLCVLCSGICVFFTPFATTYASFVTLSIFFGFFVCPIMGQVPSWDRSHHGTGPIMGQVPSWVRSHHGSGLIMGQVPSWVRSHHGSGPIMGQVP
ncbi:Major facilitator superfamily [Trinorchestia longiramus]|nr:Major facilitator superfamily [Trinorchestia longiramus]